MGEWNAAWLRLWPRLRPWIPALAGICTIAISVFAAGRLVEAEQEAIVLRTDQQAHIAAERLQRELTRHLQTLHRIAARWGEEGLPNEHQFRSQLSRVLADSAGLHSVGWIEPDVTSRWIVPDNSSHRQLEGTQPLRVERALEALERSRITGGAALSQTVDLVTEEATGFVSWIPVVHDGQTLGMMAALYLAQEIFEAAFVPPFSDYALAVYDGEARIYGDEPPPGSGQARSAVVQLYGASYRIELAPLPGAIRSAITPLPFLIGAGGCLVGFFLAMSIRWGLVARERAREAVAAREQVEAEAAARERVTIALHRSEALYRMLAANLPGSAVFLYDRELRILVAEGPLLQQLPLAVDNLEGKLAMEHVPARLADELLAPCLDALDGISSCRQFAWRGMWLLATFTPALDEQGQSWAGMVLMQDGTEQKKARDELLASTEQLRRSNEDLQEFVYIASHDLQEPLRKVQAFGSRLGARYGAVLDEQGRDYLARMLGAAERMRTLLEGLLSFSRVTTRGRPFEPCDLSSVARSVLSDLEVRIEETGAQVELEPLPTIDADPLQMRQLLQNLLSNALKFHAPGQSPHVQIKGRLVDEPQGPICELVVADDGIGFDEKYANRIFAVFQRLNGREAYEGSGIGLAICRKIVQRHGGEIIAHGEVGKGATFVVRLPAIHDVPRDTTGTGGENARIEV